MSDPFTVKHLFDWLTGSKRWRLEAQAKKFFLDQDARKERIRREAGIPEGVELLPNGSIADPDTELLWLIERVALSRRPKMILNRRGITRLPDENAQLAPTLRKLKVWNQTQSVLDGIGVLYNLDEIELSAGTWADLSPLANCPRLR